MSGLKDSLRKYDTSYEATSFSGSMSRGSCAGVDIGVSAENPAGLECDTLDRFLKDTNKQF